MKKSIALKNAGGSRALALLLGVSTQAVGKWGAELPPLRVYQLMEKRPQWFSKNIKKADTK